MRTNYTVSAEQNAVDLRKELGIPISASIDFPYIFEKLNIRLRKEPLKKDVLGACKVEGLNKLIVVSSAITNLARERFTMAHELGHIILHHGYSQCKNVDIFGSETKLGNESEANRFASALLLPPSEIVSRASSGDITFNMAGKIASHYDVSLTATLIALVKKSPLSVCVFFQTNNRIDYSVRSAECIAAPRVGLVESSVGIHTVSRENCERKGTCDYECWFHEKPNADFICTEETKLFRGFDFAISIVHIWEKD